MTYILNKTHILCRASYYRNLIFSPVAKVIHVRNSGHFSPIKLDTLIEKRFKLLDNISDDYRLIYREHNALRRVINFSYYGGWVAVLAGILSSVYIIIMDPPIQEEKIEGPFRPINPLTKDTRKIVMLFSVLIPMSLVLVSRTMPFRIYHSPSQKLFKAVFVKNLLFKTQIETFAEGTAMPKFKNFKSLTDVMFKINNRTVLLDTESFGVQAIRDKMIYKVK